MQHKQMRGTADERMRERQVGRQLSRVPRWTIDADRVRIGNNSIQSSRYHLHIRQLPSLYRRTNSLPFPSLFLSVALPSLSPVSPLLT